MMGMKGFKVNNNYVSDYIYINHTQFTTIKSPAAFAIILLIALEMIFLMFHVNFTLFLPFDQIKTGFNSYTGSTTGLGSGEVYNDPREKWTKG